MAKKTSKKESKEESSEMTKDTTSNHEHLKHEAKHEHNHEEKDDDKTPNLNDKKHSKKIYQKGISILILFLIFSAIFFVFFQMNKTNAKETYSKYNSASLAIKNYGMGSASTVENIFIKFGSLIGICLGLIIMIITYILYGILALVRLTKLKLTNLILNFSTYLLLLLFGIELVYFENRYTTLGNAVISYIGYPLMYTSIIIELSLVGLIIFIMLRSKKDVKQ